MIERILAACEQLTEQESRALRNQDMEALEDALDRRAPLVRKLESLLADSPVSPRARQLLEQMQANQQTFVQWSSTLGDELTQLKTATRQLTRLRRHYKTRTKDTAGQGFLREA